MLNKSLHVKVVIKTLRGKWRTMRVLIQDQKQMIISSSRKQLPCRSLLKDKSTTSGNLMVMRLSGCSSSLLGRVEIQ